MNLILHNACIHTMDEAKPLAEALLIRGDRIAALGTAQALRSMAPDAEVMDMQGAAIYPGMVDTHLHILNLAITSRSLELNSMRSREAALAAVAAFAKAYPEGSTIHGRGFNQDLWPDRRLPTRQELDEAAPQHAVILTRVCGHMVIANSLAIEQAGITDTVPVPEGGELDLAKGIFNENAINLLTAADQDAGVAACKELLYEGMTMAADAGLTAIYSDDFGTGGYGMHTVVAAYRALEAEGRMPVRVIQQCAMPDDASWQQFISAGYAYGQGSDLYRIGPRKLYADGSLGARTAWLSQPYADSPDRSGVPIYRQEELNRMAAQTHAAGMPFIIHAIGDAAADSVLQAVVYARQAVPGTDALPSGIVHCQITTPSLLERIADNKVTVYAQPVFAEYDLHICRDRVGAEMEKSSYNWKTLLDRGVCISSGSDCPVEPLSPARNIYCAVTRKDFDHQPAGGWMPEQCLTVDEAIRCHTVQAARTAGTSDRLGCIKPEYLADLTVFPMELEAVQPDELLDQKPLMTFVGGRLRRCP